jgi:hypothetical protein
MLYSRAHYQLLLAYRRSGNKSKAKARADIYEVLIAEEKACQLGNGIP